MRFYFSNFNRMFFVGMLLHGQCHFIFFRIKCNCTYDRSPCDGSGWLLRIVRQVPDTHSIVSAAGYHAASGGIERDTLRVSIVSGQTEFEMPCPRIADVNRLTEHGGNKSRAVGRKVTINNGCFFAFFSLFQPIGFDSKNGSQTAIVGNTNRLSIR